MRLFPILSTYLHALVAVWLKPTAAVIALVVALVAAMLVPSVALADEWGQSWISHPSADSTEQVLFRREIVIAEKPTVAHVSVASAGLFALYVNGYNVSTDVLEPGASLGGNTLAVAHYEVARYLHAGSNALAVWYSPTGHCPKTDRQLSLTLFASTDARATFACSTDSTWLCRTAGCRTLPNGDETIDANRHDPSWAIDPTFTPEWLAASEACSTSSVPLTDRWLWHMARRVESIQQYKFFETVGSNSVCYLFPNSFDGWVRLTMRGMERGDTLTVNGLTYICSGETDEQACRRFTTAYSRSALVTLPADRPLSCIMKVEAMDIGHYLHSSYSY